jgi:beta-glucosidase
MGDRTSLDLVGSQDELSTRCSPRASRSWRFLFNGRPLSIRHVSRPRAHHPRMLVPGPGDGPCGGGNALRRLQPGGKLPITIPRSVGHAPAFYNHKPSARRGYLFDEVTPLYPFGHGLSYTRFEFGPPRLEQDTIARDERARVLVDVTNTGDRSGDEVVQLYIRDLVSSVTRPVKELKGFQRITLAPGETRTVALDITPDRLAFWNIEKRRVVEPGKFAVMTGPNSVDLQSATLTVR